MTIRYHGTSGMLADSIALEGLKPCHGVVFLSRFRACALEFAAMAATVAGDAGLDPRGLLVAVDIDERLIERDGLLESIVRGPIPPDGILTMEFVEPIAPERLASWRRAEFAVLARARTAR